MTVALFCREVSHQQSVRESARTDRSPW
jgi:hypothetical protein